MAPRLFGELIRQTSSVAAVSLLTSARSHGISIPAERASLVQSEAGPRQVASQAF